MIALPPAPATSSRGDGDMVFTKGGTPQAWDVPVGRSAKADHITTGFVAGTNMLTLIVNNTAAGMQGGSRAPARPGPMSASPPNALWYADDRARHQGAHQEPALTRSRSCVPGAARRRSRSPTRATISV